MTDKTKINVVALRESEYNRWERAEKEFRLRHSEIKQRVQALRAELEFYQEQLEALPFDIMCSDMPMSLDHSDRKYTIELVEDFNPVVSGLFKMIDDFAREHGTHEAVDFNAKLFSLKQQAAETGYMIGVLAGAIFTGCTKEQIDRFERGLVFALKSNREIVSDK